MDYVQRTTSNDTYYKDPVRDEPTTPEAVRSNPLGTWARACMERSNSTRSKQLKHMKDMDDFTCGHHFTRADYAQLTAEGRPAAAFNAAQKWLRFVSGIERQAHVEVAFLPRNIHDQAQIASASLASAAHQWVVQNANGDLERSIAFADLVRRGMGWTDTALSRVEDPAGLIILERIDGMEMWWDHRAKRQCLEDARWVAREKKIPREAALLRWPKYRAEILSHGTSYEEAGRVAEAHLVNETKSVNPEESPEWSHVGPASEVCAIEFQWYDEVVGVYFFDPFEQKETWLSEREFNAFRRKYLAIGQRLAPAFVAQGIVLPVDIEHDRQIGREYKRMILVGNCVVAGPSPLPGRRFSYNCLTGEWDQDKGVWQGFMTLLVDPQRYMTKFANQALEIIVRNAKGGAYVEEDAVDNPKQFEDEHSATGSISWVKSGALGKGKILDKKSGDLPAASMQMFQVCMQMLREVTGINPEVSMGMGAGDIPMVTLRQREMATQILLATEFDTLRRYRYNEARTIFDFFPLIADARWIRIGDQYNSKSIQLVKDPFFLEYDVVMDEGSRDPYVRQQWRQTIEALAPTLIRTDNFLPEILDYLELPAQFRHQIKERIRAAAKAKQDMAAQGLTTGGRGRPVAMREVQARADKIAAEAMRTKAQAVEKLERLKSDQGQALLEAFMQWLGMEQDQQSAQEERQLRASEGASREAQTLVQAGANLLGAQIQQQQRQPQE